MTIAPPGAPRPLFWRLECAAVDWFSMRDGEGLHLHLQGSWAMSFAGRAQGILRTTATTATAKPNTNRMTNTTGNAAMRAKLNSTTYIRWALWPPPPELLLMRVKWRFTPDIMVSLPNIQRDRNINNNDSNALASALRNKFSRWRQKWLCHPQKIAVQYTTVMLTRINHSWSSSNI